jgi:hypothetical protein
MWHPKLPTGPTGSENGSTSLDPDDAFEVLSNRRRRYVVHQLLQHGDVTDLRTLSRQVAAWENRKPFDQVTSEERRRVYNALQQFHLPKLDGMGVVSYASGRGTVSSTPAAESLRSYLGGQGTHTDRRSLWMALGALAAVVAIVAFTVGGIQTLGAVVLVGVLGTTVLHQKHTSGRFGRDGPPPELARGTVEVDG